MKDRIAELTASRSRLVKQLPDVADILPGSLLSRMVRCNKTGCQYCQKGGNGHGPITILSVSLGNRRVRQIPVPGEFEEEVRERQRAFARTRDLLNQIAGVNVELLKERKLQR